MEKEKFAEFIQHYGTSTVEEAEQVLALRNDYSYSQFLQALAARVSRDHNWGNQNEILQQAAIHCTDRAVLKEIMTAASPKATLTTESQPKAKHSKSSHDFADEVFSDLEKLKQSKKVFESMLNATSQSQLPIQETGSTIKKPKRAVLKSKKERIVEMAKKLDAAISSSTEQSTPVKVSVKKPSHADPLIEAIKTTRKKIKPENEKTREQIEIINQFIKAKPVIAPSPATSDETAPDMSESIRSGEFSDHIVSETLVEILLKQGKKDKAIEVLKKLIWKFPQKKTYFAARIDELKK